MTRANEQKTLDELPLFASDRDIAEALVGKAAADKWVRERLPGLANKPGFPPIDPFHGGRPVPLVKKFYEHYLGVVAGVVKAEIVEDEGVWRRSRRQA